MAKTGYGKRSAGDEDPHADPDFAHLTGRERDLAVFMDRLQDGHAAGYKAIAAEHPLYGQQAVRASQGRLSSAGHLHRIREHITLEDNSMRWVTRTYWSRTPRSAEWWEEFARSRNGRIVTDGYESGLARVEEAEETAPEAEAGQAPGDEPQVTAAYRTLAELRDADRRMPLSESDCRSLESLAAEWLSRGATPDDITRALTDGLPSAVSNPGGFARNRLEKKMPPKKAKVRQKKASLRGRVDRVLRACLTCDADERTVEIIQSMCRDCRVELGLETPEGERIPQIPQTFTGGRMPTVEEVHEFAAQVRAAGGLRSPGGRALRGRV
ncbi:hypothetical protein [Streptomyces camelliae]|uniref:Uncharacterized protein n=1 Tax=Streptomyces camelliae TaxID=3004093 RepID=A0ABY7P982_9ACTN|nr:hypothetical protein [Streptomyces sp. HUAS 2-6]WBO64833.1 hypothetical protein O1G22_19330 [Streptomyces sp. HUAS 2-6]